MMSATIKARMRVVQIWLNYKERTGTSAVTGDGAKAFWLGMRMIALIFEKRLAR